MLSPSFTPGALDSQDSLDSQRPTINRGPEGYCFHLRQGAKGLSRKVSKASEQER